VRRDFSVLFIGRKTNCLSRLFTGFVLAGETPENPHFWRIVWYFFAGVADSPGDDIFY
jgi:hypothetical protein